MSKQLNKKQITKLNIRFAKEELVKCGSCKYFFNSFCDLHEIKRYRDEKICFKYDKHDKTEES